VTGVNQAVVDAMLDRGVTALLGLAPEAIGEAWRRLTPDYTPGTASPSGQPEQLI